MVKFGGEIGTLYQISSFKHPLQNRTNVQTKGGGEGVKGLLNNVQKNCTFLNGWLPLGRSLSTLKTTSRDLCVPFSGFHRVLLSPLHFFYLFTDSCSLIYFILRSSGKSKHVCILQCRISTFQCNLLPQLTNNKSVCKAEFYQSTNFALMFGRLYVTIIQGFQNSSDPVPCIALTNNITKYV